MIVLYNDKGEIEGVINGNYNIERHNLENKNYLEVDEQNVKGKKVDIENEQLKEAE
jgi:hypothetical protein